MVFRLPGHLREQEQLIEEWAAQHGVDVTDLNPNLIKSIRNKKENLTQIQNSNTETQQETDNNLSSLDKSERYSEDKQFGINDKKHQ